MDKLSYSIDPEWVVEVLDRIGMTERLRRTHKNCALVRETISSMIFLFLGIPYRTYHFGSAIEGTTTPEMDPDLDTLSAKKDAVVVEELDAGSILEEGYLVVSDNDTYPGYVKLQFVVDGRPLTCSDMHMSFIDFAKSKYNINMDRFGKLVLSIPELQHHPQLPYTKHGPAVTRNTKSGQQIDFVFAYQCHTWNIIAQEWFDRERFYNWPDRETINRFRKLGFFLVPVSHPHSREQGRDWRISFSLQERELMFSLSDVQYKCYVLLKLIKSKLINPVVKDAISSFHMKTSLLYVIERNPSDLWKNRELLHGTFKCLEYLLYCIQEDNCPNYFIPEENMFMGRINEENRSQVESVLRKILENWPRCLLNIQSDNFDKYLVSKDNQRDQSMLAIDSNFAIKSREYFILRGAVVSALEYKLEFIKSIKVSERLHTAEDILWGIDKIYDQINMLSWLTSAGEHTPTHAMESLLILKPYFYTLIGSHLIAFGIQSDIQGENADVSSAYIIEGRKRLLQGERSDLTSGVLKYAAALFSLKCYQECSSKLDLLEQNMPHTIISVCQCRDKQLLISRNMIEVLSNFSRSRIRNFQRLISTCLMFLPTEAQIVSDALQYEFYRCFGTDKKSRFSVTDAWYDWIVVDGIVYLYFLKYLVGKDLGKPYDYRIRIFEKLETLLDDPNLGHTETAYNLLSWMAMSENLPLKALNYISQSWGYLSWLVSSYNLPEGNEKNNAAKWHMLILLFRIWYQKSYSGDNENYINFCFECMKVIGLNALICDGCNVAKYCSLRCHKTNWTTHQLVCKMNGVHI